MDYSLLPVTIREEGAGPPSEAAAEDRQADEGRRRRRWLNPHKSLRRLNLFCYHIAISDIPGDAIFNLFALPLIALPGISPRIVTGRKRLARGFR
ncbi:hypothetical protein [Mesorhizobium sp. M0488]|uniref:hypothetical protein n=1 Tax=unclassified Mesorhizobium TaxID=325217 RepID=UPI0033354131